MSTNLLVNGLVATNDTGGTMYDVTVANPTTDNLEVFSFSGKKFKRTRDGMHFRASWAISGSADCTTTLQNIFNLSTVNTVIFDSQDYVINGALNVPAGKIMQFKCNGRLTGTGAISGGLIKADFTKQCFATTLSFTGVGTVHAKYSATWFGTVGDGAADDYQAIQNAINVTIASNSTKRLLFLKGTYKHNTPLMVYNWDGTKYDFNTIYMEGIQNEKEPSRNFVSIRPGTGVPFSIGMQNSRGCIIENISFYGNYTKMVGMSQKTLINPATDFTQSGISTNKLCPYTAIVLDPFTASGQVSAPNQWSGQSSWYRGILTRAGCSDITIRGCGFQRFFLDIMLTGNNYTQECELINLYDLSINDSYTGIATTQAQAKQNVAKNIMCWGVVYTVFDSASFGYQFGGGGGTEFMIDGANLAGNVYQLINGNATSYPIIVKNVFAESTFKVGNITNSMPVLFRDCQFDLMSAQDDYPSPDSILGSSASTNHITWAGGHIRYLTGVVSNAARLPFLNSSIAFKDTDLELYPVTYPTAFGTYAGRRPTFNNVSLNYASASRFGIAGYNNSGAVPANVIPEGGNGFYNTAGTLLNTSKFIYDSSAETWTPIGNITTFAFDNTTGNSTATVTSGQLAYLRVGSNLVGLNVDSSGEYYLGCITQIVGTTITLKKGQINLPASAASINVVVSNTKQYNYPIVGTLTHGSPTVTNVEYNASLSFTNNNILHHWAVLGLQIIAYDDTAKTLTLSGNANLSNSSTTASGGDTLPHATLNQTVKAEYSSALYPMQVPPTSGQTWGLTSAYNFILEGGIWTVDAARVYGGVTDFSRQAKFIIKYTSYSNSTLHPFSFTTLGGAPFLTTIAEMRRFYGYASIQFDVQDLTKQGLFYYDATDTTTPDDGVNVIVGLGNARFKRVAATAATNGISTAIQTIVADTTVTNSMHTLLVDSSGGNVTLTFVPSSLTGYEFVVKKISSDSNVISLGTVDGATMTLTIQYETLKVQSNGTAMFQIP